MNHTNTEIVHGVLNFLNELREGMEYFLRWLVISESPSSEPESQEKIINILSDSLERVNYKVQRVGRQEKFGGHLLSIPKRRAKNHPSQLLLGHCDTVWPKGTLKEMPEVIENGKMRGPGVYDMKGGLVQLVYALKAIHELKLEPPLTPVVFINSDEETGSLNSTRYIKCLAQCASRAFVMEPSLGLKGKLKTARKGASRYTVVVKGKAAHAGLNPEGGASAILELAHIIQQLFALNDSVKGITVNVGMIDGGLRPNVIAPESKAMVDVRVMTYQDAMEIDDKIKSLSAHTPGTKIEVLGGIGRPPLERTEGNRKLWELAKELGNVLGIELEEGIAGGSSDGNTTSQYIPTLDGLGAVGDGAHATHEHIILDKMIERAALLTLLIMSPQVV